MKNFVLLIILIFASFVSAKAQTKKKMPERIIHDASNSYYDTKTRMNSAIHIYYIKYNDGSIGEVDFRQIKRTVPNARKYLRLHSLSIFSQAGTTLVGMGGLGVIGYSIFEKNLLYTLIGSVGTVGGFWGTVHFGKKKKVYLENFLDSCNDYFAKEIEKSKKIGLNLKAIEPDYMQFGSLNNNNVGISLTWNLSK